MLPTIRTRDEYKALHGDNARWLPAMEVLCARHGLDARLRRETLGTHVVFRSGDFILKLFCTLWPEDVIGEREALRHLHGLPVPQLVAEGDLEGWPYVILTAVPGRPAVDVWPGLDSRQRRSVVEQLGQFMRRLHDQRPVPELATDWNEFLREREATWEEHHLGAWNAPGGEGRTVSPGDRADAWRGWIRSRVSGFREAPFDPVLLNADLTTDHVLLEERRGRWRISGVIDFGDAMMGHRYYEFIAPLAFYSFGAPELSRALVESYGLSLTPALADRLTTYCLLHRHGSLGTFLQRVSVADGVAFHEALWGRME